MFAANRSEPCWPSERRCGLILAAGESRRMGFPKALLAFRGETFLGPPDRIFRRPLLARDGGAGRARGPDSRGRPRARHIRVNADYQRDRPLRCSADCAHPCRCRWRPLHAGGPSGGGARRRSTPCWPEGNSPVVRVPRYKGRRGHPISFAPRTDRGVSGAAAHGAARESCAGHAPKRHSSTWTTPASSPISTTPPRTAASPECANEAPGRLSS